MSQTLWLELLHRSDFYSATRNLLGSFDTPAFAKPHRLSLSSNGRMNSFCAMLLSRNLLALAASRGDLFVEDMFIVFR